MKKFIRKILLFTFLLVLCDTVVGIATAYLVDHAVGGQTQKNEYIADHAAEDILIFGSSHAVHHYDPTIITDSLGMTCYNCGYDGCGSITAYGLLKLVTARYNPKVIIYEVTPKFDYLMADKDNSKYLGPLKYYFDRYGIDSIFEKVSPVERLKMQSHLYRINSNAIQIISDYILNRNGSGSGYMPKDKQMEYEPVIDETRKEMLYDPLKEECLKNIITICKSKGIRLIFCVSPSYKKTDDYEFAMASKLSDMYQIPFLNHYCDTVFTTHKEYFYDSGHLNIQGAESYTRKLSKELKEYVK